MSSHPGTARIAAAMGVLGLLAPGLLVLSGTAQAKAPVAVTVAPTPAQLTLENAVPLAVPPRPALRTPGPIKAPPRLVLPQVLEAPPPPALIEGPAAAQQTARQAPPTAPAAASNPPAPGLAGTPPQAVPPAAAPRTDTASLPPPPTTAPPAASMAPGNVLSLAFQDDSATLPAGADAMVDRIVERLRASDTARLQLRSYASGTADTAREARQLSLARALALRERLTAFGIRSTRVDVRALGLGDGGAVEAGAPDRIDAVFLNE